MRFLVIVFVIKCLIYYALSMPVAQNTEAPNSTVMLSNDDDDNAAFVKQEKLNFSALFQDLNRLKTKKSQNEIKNIATAGILTGTLKVEQQMSEHLSDITTEFFQKFNQSTTEENLEKLFQIEQTMERDRRAVEILQNALDFAVNAKTYEEYKEDMEQIGRVSELTLLEFAKKKLASNMIARPADDNSLKMNVTKQMQSIKTMVNNHLKSIHSGIRSKAKATIKYLKTQKKASAAAPEKVSLGLLQNILKQPVQDYSAMDDEQIIEESRVHNFAVPNNLRRQDVKGDENQGKEVKDNEIDQEFELKLPMKGNQEVEIAADGEESESESVEEPQGGIVGLIASLSGGDEGSDIGALIGALSGIITNLFGPGGLDIPSLLGTATSLISGLLAGEENFGKVLGGYIGTAVDGFSGGGGATLNGNFFGQFLATVYAQLSADPEDDDLPPKPKLFIEGLFAGSKQATSKAGDAEGGGEGEHKPSGGSDVFGFVGNIVSSIVGGITSLILNASVGSSGGSSQGSASASAGFSGSSSQQSPHPSHPHPQ